ncbi:hypothetical protein AB7X32_20350 [Morganella morganii]|uniref:hypothetical protein n=1 Tax=Morganella morganii TaxID=582 RepID=UPI0034E4A726
MKNPKLIVKPFAKNGQKNVIPENYETSMESNQATWDQGFGQITMLPVAAGGLPPKGQDFNGIFNQISENIVYLSQGGRFKFSAEYAEAIGGYPKGAILQSDDEKKEYLSLIDNNKVDFNTATDISASWKLVNTDDLLSQIASKQPKGDYATKTELNSGLAGKQPTGDYATKTDLDKKLDQSAVVQNTGTSTKNVMSQKAVTDELNNKFDKTGGKITGQTDIEAPGGRAQTLKATAGTSIYQELYLLEALAAWVGITNGNTLTLANSIAGKRLTISPDGFKIDGRDIATTTQLLGVGQTYKDVTASRKNGVTYTNNSTKPIIVCVECNRTAATSDDPYSFGAVVDGQRVAYRWTQANEISMLCFIVPPGSSYYVQGGWGQTHPWEPLVKWIELS